LLGAEYLAAALNPAKKKVPVPEHFKEGVNNIIVTTVSDFFEDHILLSIDNSYHCYGVGEPLGPITHALLDTRFLPGIEAGVETPFRIKEVVDCPDRHFIHNVLKTYLPANVRFCEGFYHGCNEEKMSSRDNFFEESVLRVTTCIFPNRGESTSDVAVRICGGRKMLNVHDPRRYRRYSVKRAYLNETSRSIFQGELRMQTYIDIIEPSCVEGTVF
jgi:hypothetical protein